MRRLVEHNGRIVITCQIGKLKIRRVYRDCKVAIVYNSEEGYIRIHEMYSGIATTNGTEMICRKNKPIFTVELN